MADLSKLSDEDLSALAKKDLSKVSDEGLKYLHDQTVPPEPGLGSRILGAVGNVGRMVDSVTGAPTRAAIGAIQDGKGPLSAFAGQFAQNPDLAPTGKGIAEKMGVSTTHPAPGIGYAEAKTGIPSENTTPPASPAEAVGAAIDLGANPVNFAGPVMRVAGKGIEALGKIPYLGDLAEGVGKLPTKAAGMLTGLPEKAIETYAKRGGEVKNLLAEAGGEVPTAADDLKTNILQTISTKKKELGAEIQGALAGNKNQYVNSQPIIDALEAQKAKLNPHTHPAAIPQIDEQIHTLKALSVNNKPATPYPGMESPDNHWITLPNLFDAKKHFQTLAKSTYVKDGQLFTPAAESAQAAKTAGALSRSALHEASPEIAHADAIYSDLHDIDDKMSASLLGTGKAENIFASAGGGKGNVHQVMLRRVGDITGTDPVADAELIHAAKYMKPGQEGFNVDKNLLKAYLDTKRAAGAAVGAIPTGSIPALVNASQLTPKYADILGGQNRSLAAPDDAMRRRLNPGH